MRGRTYAVPFTKVWKASLVVVGGGISRWSLVAADEDAGVQRAEARTLLLRSVHDVEIRLSLDEFGQTRVDMKSASRTRRGDLGVNARRIRSFFRALDRNLGAGPGVVLDPTRSPLRLGILLLALLLACSPPEESQNAGGDQATPPEDPARNFQGRSYERHIVFLTTRGDSTLIVPWSFSAHTKPDGVDREIRAWLARSDTWDPFMSDRWETPPTRTPWRILPQGSARLIMGQGNALERVYFQEGARHLEVELGELLADWTGLRAQTFRVHRGATLLSNRRVEGFVLDMARAWTDADMPPGGWCFLISGDSLQVVLEASEPGGGEEAYTGWARRGFSDLQWRDLRLPWSEVRAFESARRDVPISWTLSSPDGTVAGELNSVNPLMELGEGEGPVLPVDALFQVTGSLSIEGASFPIRGLIRHFQR
jgi:hypothetical protein